MVGCNQERAVMKKSVAAPCLAVFALSIATGALAEDLVIPLPKDTAVEKVETTYQCAADRVEAVYFNAA